MRTYQDSTSNIARRAAATNARRKLGDPTPAQKAAARRYINGGKAALLPGDVELIKAHPYMRGFSL